MKNYYRKMRVLSKSPFERTKIKNAIAAEALHNKTIEECLSHWLGGATAETASDAMIFVEISSNLLVAKNVIWTTDVC